MPFEFYYKEISEELSKATIAFCNKKAGDMEKNPRKK
jgi:hypothetical protein